MDAYWLWSWLEGHWFLAVSWWWQAHLDKHQIEVHMLGSHGESGSLQWPYRNAFPSKIGNSVSGTITFLQAKLCKNAVRDLGLSLSDVTQGNLQMSITIIRRNLSGQAKHFYKGRTCCSPQNGNSGSLCSQQHHQLQQGCLRKMAKIRICDHCKVVLPSKWRAKRKDLEILP